MSNQDIHRLLLAYLAIIKTVVIGKYFDFSGQLGRPFTAVMHNPELEQEYVSVLSQVDQFVRLAMTGRKAYNKACTNDGFNFLLRSVI